MRKKAALVLALLGCSRLVAVTDPSGSTCPPGEPMQWIADYCMAKIGTDDEIAASACISKESAVVFRNDCASKLHFKRKLCEIVVRARTRKGTVDACVTDPQFAGRTVKNGGAGGTPRAPAKPPTHNR